MKVHTLGAGPPEVAVVACLHGDERCGERAIERVLDELDEETVLRPVAFVIANERAVERGRRSIDADLNRSFPGDPESDLHEERLAHELLEVLADATAVLDLHATESESPPFAIVHGPTRETLDLVRALGLEEAVDMSSQGAALLSQVDGVAVECGRRGSDAAADVATDVTRRFLQATGVLPGSAASTDPTWYRVDRQLPKGAGAWTVLAENFERVPAGEAYATTGAETLIAERAFYPVLLSAGGYETILGFAADRVDADSLLGDRA